MLTVKCFTWLMRGLHNTGLDCNSYAKMTASPCSTAKAPAPVPDFVDADHPVLRGEHLLKVLEADVLAADVDIPDAVPAPAAKGRLRRVRKAVVAQLVHQAVQQGLPPDTAASESLKPVHSQYVAAAPPESLISQMVRAKY